MAQKVTFDFSRVATLAHILGGTATFNATAELGRARLTIGAADAATRVAAPKLGAWANGISYTVWARGGATRQVVYDGASLRVGKATGDTAEQVADAINASSRDPRRFYATTLPDNLTSSTRAQRPSDGSQGAYLDLGADVAGGSGADPAATGTGVLAGGADPQFQGGNAVQYVASTGNGGLFVFDHEEPLVLVQFMASLSGAVAWELTLRRVSPARADEGVALPIANANSQNILVTTPSVVIPPGWGIGFSASAQGGAFVMVRKA